MTDLLDLSASLLYIFVVCICNAAVMLKLESMLIWFEGWFIHFAGGVH